MISFLKLSNATGKRLHLMILERNYKKILDFQRLNSESPNTIFNFCFSAREIFLLIQPEVKGSKMFLLERLNLK